MKKTKKLKPQIRQERLEELLLQAVDAVFAQSGREIPVR
jgi:hypothetical protein